MSLVTVPGAGVGMKPPKTYRWLLATAQPPGKCSGLTGQSALAVNVPVAGSKAVVRPVMRELAPEPPAIKMRWPSGKVSTPPAMLDVLASGRVADINDQVLEATL